MTGLFGFDATNKRDEQIIVLADGYSAKCGASDGYWAEVTSDREVKVVTSADTSTIQVIKGIPQHFNGTIGTTPATIIPATSTTAIIINNMSSNPGGAKLYVSFDSGANFFEMDRKGVMEIETEISTFQIKSNIASANYQIVVTYK